MIITRQKKIDDILDAIQGSPVFIVGCGECAALCHTGGEDEVLSMKKMLEDKDVEVTGWVVLDPACHLQKDRHVLRSYRRELQRAKKVLVLSCGNGVQVISEILHNIEVVSGTDTLFLGEIRHANDFEKRCMMCGECIIDVFESMCPISRCPKHMLNGPCGGSRNGKCEVYPELDCIWFLIYNRLIERGKVLLYKKIQEPKDWSKSLEMRRILE